ncbi:efflux RND transporter periplasmic adaptor subunit [Botrimarina mediterranea]|uniref:efflux RND transporter periplasmic adaptor subunit n=1 Tax=Botrimarina mediterranea TaxID=2528022 RepID=UPI00119FB9DF
MPSPIRGVTAVLGLALALIAFAGGVVVASLDTPVARWARAWRGDTAVDHDDHDDHEGHDHEVHDDEHADHAHDHNHEGHSEEASLELSAAAMANLGLGPETVRPVETSTYVRSVSVPAVVVERPGRSRLPVSAPMTGVVTHVHAVTGEAVTPGTLLFELRLTHEDLVNSQKEFLQTLGNLDVEEKEVARLEEVSASGAVPGKVLLERKYARDKLLASLASQREALRLHGLSMEQVDRIATDRRLLTQMRVFAPSLDDHSHPHGDGIQLSNTPPVQQALFTDEEAATDDEPTHHTPASDPLVVQSLDIHKGETVNTGDVLCVLADYSELYIEGAAFETDATAVAEAKRRGWKATAVVEQLGSERDLTGLSIAYLANEVNAASRTLPFYVSLKNEIVEDTQNESGQRFLSWRYRPGQRMQLRVPVEEWADQIVLPAGAVVKEGPDSFVFVQNGDHFDRIAVHERYRDRRSVVVANDGAVFPGDSVAMTGAHQMQLALKNKAGGAIDPHAGHNH